MAPIQAVKDALDTAGADAKKEKEQLDFLLGIAQRKLELYTRDLKDTFAGLDSSDSDPIKLV
jgi:hypothetical protein